MPPFASMCCDTKLVLESQSERNAAFATSLFKISILFVMRFFTFE